MGGKLQFLLIISKNATGSNAAFSTRFLLLEVTLTTLSVQSRVNDNEMIRTCFFQKGAYGKIGTVVKAKKARGSEHFWPQAITGVGAMVRGTGQQVFSSMDFLWLLPFRL